MSNRYSHLVWLGAGNATEPQHVLSLADKATLYEAREAACRLLKKNNPQANITIKQTLVTIDGIPVHFTEYNLPEYSAVHPVAGLNLLFPGIKPVRRERVESVSIIAAIEELALEGNNNVLIVDIADCNLALLNALQQNKQLDCFSEIMIQAGNEPLYSGAATVTEIESFLQAQGYMLKQTSGNDPDVPWLTFVLNPLWQTFQQVCAQLSAFQLQYTEVSKGYEQLKVENESLQVALETAQKHAAARLERIGQLEKNNKTLDEANEQLAKQQQALKQELMKAETQIDIIKELFLKQ